jgi:hypothetical protein
MCKRGNAFSLPVLIARLNLIALIFNAHHQSESGASRRKTASLISRITVDDRPACLDVTSRLGDADAAISIGDVLMRPLPAWWY